MYVCVRFIPTTLDMCKTRSIQKETYLLEDPTRWALHFNFELSTDDFENVYDGIWFFLIIRAFVVDLETMNPDLPNGNDFVTRTRYCFWSIGPEQCHLKVTGMLEFIKSTSTASKNHFTSPSSPTPAESCVSRETGLNLSLYSSSRPLIGSIEKNIRQNLHDYIQALSIYLQLRLGRIAHTTETKDASSTTMNVPRTDQTPSSMEPSISVRQVLRVLFVGDTSLMANEHDLIYLLVILILALGISIKLFSELVNLKKMTSVYQPNEN
jgi:hypothetical protein